MSRNLVIIHFQALEKYPPAINFIRYIAQQSGNKFNIQVLTTHPGENKKTIEFGGVQVLRLAIWKIRGRIGRLLFYLLFNIKALVILLKCRPGQIVYFETLSAFAPWVYKKFINKRARIFIHYHEYTSPAEYQTGMALSRWLHKQERQLYRGAAWISHTNSDRMNFFQQDVGKDEVNNPQIMPNYPSATWHNTALGVQPNNDKRVAFVYVGALSLNNMHTREMTQYVAANSDKCYWHIYSDNHDDEVFAFLESLKVNNIEFKGGVLYDELPAILPQYDIGVILYTGNTPNYAYNAPNKFFEYIACGLNVWFGNGMKGMSYYEHLNQKPYVRCMNFEQLTPLSIASEKRISTIPNQQYTAEEVYKQLWVLINE